MRGAGGVGHIHAVGKQCVCLSPADKRLRGASKEAVQASEVERGGGQSEGIGVPGGGDGERGWVGEAPVGEMGREGGSRGKVDGVRVGDERAGAADVSVGGGQRPRVHGAADVGPDGPRAFVPCHWREDGFSAHGVCLVFGPGTGG